MVVEISIASMVFLVLAAIVCFLGFTSRDKDYSYLAVVGGFMLLVSGVLDFTGAMRVSLIALGVFFIAAGWFK